MEMKIADCILCAHSVTMLNLILYYQLNSSALGGVQSMQKAGVVAGSQIYIL